VPVHLMRGVGLCAPNTAVPVPYLSATSMNENTRSEHSRDCDDGPTGPGPVAEPPGHRTHRT
jgi:hypothetical protein